MSPLEDALSEQKGLINKGYSVQDIQCAALMLIASYLQPRILVQEHNMPEHKDGAD
jgi:hypothetical protein